MKTAIDWFNEQIKLNSEFRENLKGRVSFTIGLSKIDELYNQAKEMEKEQITEAFKKGVSYWNGDEWKLIDIEGYYNETYKK